MLIYCATCLSVYTVAVQVSDSNQNFSLQVDTGSSDLVRVYLIDCPPILTVPLSVDRINILFLYCML